MTSDFMHRPSSKITATLYNACGGSKRANVSLFVGKLTEFRGTC